MDRSDYQYVTFRLQAKQAFRMSLQSNILTALQSMTLKCHSSFLVELSIVPTIVSD
jgi:hypothetical protein